MAQTESIGTRVRKLREQQKWTQEDLADRLYMKRTALRNKELDERAFTLDELEKIADIFQVSTDWLIRGVKAKNLSFWKGLGLNDSAVKGIQEHNAVYVAADPEANPPIEKSFTYIGPDPALNAALASPAILQALSDYMAFEADSKEKAVGRAEKNNGFVDCRMSEGMYEAVLGQNLLRIIDAVKRGEEPDLFSPGLVFGVIEEGGEADAEEK